jgi:hypothetical protein
VFLPLHFILISKIRKLPCRVVLLVVYLKCLYCSSDYNSLSQSPAKVHGKAPNDVLNVQWTESKQVNIKNMKLKQLEMALQDVDVFESPKVETLFFCSNISRSS